MYAKQLMPSLVLDNRTMVKAGTHDEVLYCLDTITSDALFRDADKMKGENYDIHNYLFVPSQTLTKAKFPVEKLHGEMTQYPFFKGSKFSPSIYRINEAADNFDKRAEAVLSIMDRRLAQAHRIANYWMLEKVDGSYYPIFCGRVILDKVKEDVEPQG